MGIHRGVVMPTPYGRGRIKQCCDPFVCTSVCPTFLTQQWCILGQWLLQNTHTHTTVLLLFWNMSGTTRLSKYQKGKTRKVKTNLDLVEQEIVSGSGICWAICKSAPHPRQPRQHPTTQFFYRPDALPAAQPTADVKALKE